MAAKVKARRRAGERGSKSVKDSYQYMHQNGADWFATNPERHNSVTSDEFLFHGDRPYNGNDVTFKAIESDVTQTNWMKPYEGK